MLCAFWWRLFGLLNPVLYLPYLCKSACKACVLIFNTWFTLMSRFRIKTFYYKWHENPHIISKCCERFPEYWWATFILCMTREFQFFGCIMLYKLHKGFPIYKRLYVIFIWETFSNMSFLCCCLRLVQNCCQVVKLKFHTKSRIIDNIFLAWNLFSFKSKIFGYMCLWYLKQISLHKLIFNVLIVVAKSFIV